MRVLTPNRARGDGPDAVVVGDPPMRLGDTGPAEGFTAGPPVVPLVHVDRWVFACSTGAEYPRHGVFHGPDTALLDVADLSGDSTDGRARDLLRVLEPIAPCLG